MCTQKDAPDWAEILTFFRGSELQNFFTKILEDHLKAVIKPQYVDQIPKTVKGPVNEMLSKRCELDENELNTVIEDFGNLFILMKLKKKCIISI